MSKLYTKKEAAKLLGISEESVRKYCQQGKFKAERIGSVGTDAGGMYVIYEKEMQRLLKMYKKS